MADKIEIEYDLDFSSVSQGTNAVLSLMRQLEATVNGIGGNASFGTLAGSQSVYNQQISDSVKIFTELQASANAYKEEAKRLREIEKELIALRLQAKNSDQYDKLQKDLVAVRTRIQEVKEGIRSMGNEGEKSIGKVTVSFNSFTAVLRNAIAYLGIYSGIGFFKNLARDIVEIGGKAENFLIGTSTILKRLELAKQLDRDLTAFSLKTGFTLPQLQEQTQKLLAYRIGVNDIIPTLTILGNIASAVGLDKLPRLTLAFGQVRNVGRLMGQELRQFTEAGVPLLAVLADQTGESVAQVQARVKAGKVTFTEVNNALKSLSAEGGDFAGLLEKQSESLTGKLSNLSDTVAQGYIRIERANDSTFKGMVQSATDFVNALVGSDGALKRTGDGIKTLISAIITYNLVSNASVIAETALTLIRKAGLIIRGYYIIATTAMTGSTVALTLAETEATVAATAFNTALKANPLGLIISVIGIAVTAYYALKTAQDEVTSSLGEQEVNLRSNHTAQIALIDSTIKENKESQTRIALIKSIRQQYPDLLKGIKDEDVTTGFLLATRKKLNDEYGRSLVLAKANFIQERNLEKIKENVNKDQDIVDEFKKKYPQLSKGVADINQVESLLRSSGKGQNTVTDLDGKQKKFNTDFLTKVLERRKESVQEDKLLEDNLKEGQKRVALFKSGTESLALSQYNIQKAIADKYEGKKLNDIKDRQERDKVVFARKAVEDYKLANPEPFAGDSIGGKDTKGKADSEARKREARIQSERNALFELLKAERDFQDRIQKLQLDSDNVRLEMLDKFSVDYLQKKEDYDRKQLKQEERLEIERYGLSQKVTKTLPNGKTETRSILEYAEAERLGKGDTKEQAVAGAFNDIKMQFNVDKDTEIIRQYFELKDQLITSKLSKDYSDLARKQSKIITDQLGEGLFNEIGKLNDQFFDLIRENPEIADFLGKSRDFKIEGKRLSANQKNVDADNELRRANAEASIKKGGNKGVSISESDEDYQVRKNDTLLKIDAQYYQESLTVLEEYLASEAYLNALSNGIITEEEKKANDQRASLLRIALQKNLNEQTENLEKKSGLIKKYSDIWSQLGDIFTGFTGKESGFLSGQSVAQKQTRESIDIFVSASKDALTAMFDYETEISRQRLALYERELSEKTALIEVERQKKKDGLANSFDDVNKDVQNLKKLRNDELQQQKQIQKDKAKIDALVIASSTAVTVATLLQAMAKAIASTSGIPFVGIALGLAAAATLFSGFTSIKAKIAQANAPTLRKGARLEGNSHEKGGMNIYDDDGDVKYNVEGGEWLMGSAPSSKHNDFLSHLNNNTFGSLPKHTQDAMLIRMGYKAQNERFMNDISNTELLVRTQQVEREKQIHFDTKNIEELLKKVISNTNDKPSLQYTEKGKFAKMVNGELVGFEIHPHLNHE